MSQKSSSHKFSSKSNADQVALHADLKGKVAIVTGANTGIGLVTARTFAKIGAHVIMACRDKNRGQVALDNVKQATGSTTVELMQLDLSSVDSIRAFVTEFRRKELPLHYLVNNAGVYATTLTRTSEGFEPHLGVNHLGHFLLTYELVDILKASAPSRIITVSAHGHKMIKSIPWDDLKMEKSWSAFNAVGVSKTFNIWHATELHRRLSTFGVSAFSLHPGLVKSEIARDSWWLWLVSAIGGVSCEQGAATTMFVALYADPATQGGEYFANCKVDSKSKLSADAALAQRAWDVSVQLLGLNALEVEAKVQANNKQVDC